VNNLELYTLVAFDVFMNSQIHEFDGHLAHSNTNFNMLTDYVKLDPTRVLSRTVRTSFSKNKFQQEMSVQ
jgi:hypothetical protein